MDIQTFLLHIGKAYQNKSDMFEEYKGYKRSINSDYYFEFIIDKTDEGYKWDLVVYEVGNVEDVQKKLFYVKMPSNSIPYFPSCSLKQFFMPNEDGSVSERCFVLFDYMAKLLNDNKYKEELANFYQSFIKNENIIHPEDWNGNVNNFFEQRYGKFIKDAPITIVLNGERLSDLKIFRDLWVQQYFKIKPSKFKCIYCGSNENIISEGSKKWKIYTVTRDTEVNKKYGSYHRCMECENLISKGIDVIDKIKFKDETLSFANESVQSYYLPVVYEEEVIRSIYDILSKPKDRIDFFRQLLIIRDELELNDLKFVYRLSFGCSRDNTFTLLDSELINIDDIDIQTLDKRSYEYETFIDKYKMKTFGWINNKALPYYLLNQIDFNKKKFNREHYLYNRIRDEFYNISYRADTVNVQQLYYLLNELNKHINRKNNYEEERLYYIMLYHYFMKGENVMDLVNSKEYALGVLVSIADQIQRRKYNKNNSKDYISPIKKQFGGKLHDFNLIVSEAIRIIGQNENYMYPYYKEVYRLALNKLTNDSVKKPYDLIAYQMGLNAKDYYADVNKEEFFEKITKKNVDNDSE